MSQIVRARPGTAALLVLMATSGVVLTYGRQDGDVLRGARLLGRLLLGDGRDPSAASALVTLPLTTPLVGALHHIALTLLWGLALGLLVRPFRGVAYALAALVGSVTFSLLNLWVIPPIFGVGFATVTTPGRAIPLALAVTVALLVTPWASGVRGRPTSS